MEFFDVTIITIMLTSLLASAFSVAFGFGGVFVLIGGMTLVIPMEAILPLQAAGMMSSMIARMFLLRTHIDWSYVKTFFIGCLFGTVLGAMLYTSLPTRTVALALAMVMFLAAWAPKASFRLKLPHAEIIVGGIHSFLSTAFSFGGFMQAAIFRNKSFNRMQVTATIAACSCAMTLIKIPSYAGFGFDYGPYVGVILACWIMAIPGTWAGRHFLNRMPETVFRYGFKAMLTIVGLRLVWIAISPAVK
ncbi:MAG: sulfite exporter TauE/SafE family protein [Porticoccaceae bacterium]